MALPGDEHACDRLAAGLLAGAFAFKLAVALGSLGRGFELGDGGYFLLNLNHPEGAPAVFQFYRLLPAASHASDYGVRDARVLRLAAELVASLLLLSGVYAWACRRFWAPGTARPGAFAGIALAGALLTTGSRTFGYNDMSSLCSYAAVGALFAGAAARSAAGRAAAALAAGFAGGLELGVKFPSALALLALAALAWAALFPGLARRERARLVALVGAGALAAGALYVVRAGGLAPLADALRPMRELARLSGYAPSGILARYAAGEVVTLLHLGVAALAAALAGRALSRRRPALAPDARSALALLAGAAALALGTTLVHPFFLHPTALALAAGLGFLLLAGLRLAGRALRAEPGPPDTPAWRAMAPLLLLLALPPVNVLGSNVPLSMRLPAHALPLFALLAVLGLALRPRFLGGRTALAAVAILVALTSAVVVQHQLVRPYGLVRPLWEQTEEPAGLPGIRVDAPTRAFLEAVALRLHEAGFEPGAPLVALDYMPGLVFYLGGTSPGSNLYLFDRPALNCFQLARAGASARTRDGAPPWFLLGRPLSDEQRACLAPLGVERDLRLLARIPFPFESVYAGWDAPGMTHLHVYAPRTGAAARLDPAGRPGAPW